MASRRAGMWCARRLLASEANKGTGATMSGSSSVDPREIEKFAKRANEWWDTGGTYGPLHRLNYARSPFIRMAACDHYGLHAEQRRPLESLSVVEVGCGGGILSETLAAMGGKVTAIDAAEESIEVAREHLKRNTVVPDGRLSYVATTGEALASENRRFDVVVSSEVVEHVVDPPSFCRTLAELCKPGGLVVMSTINRTVWSYSLAIVAAERILGMAPRGAHDWNQFVTPDELTIMCEDAGLGLTAVSGMRWSLPKNQFELSRDTSVNYIAAFSKAGDRGAGE